MDEIRNLACMDGWLYFTYEESVPDSACDVGWREGFRRVGTASYPFHRVQERPELLFSYETADIT